MNILFRVDSSSTIGIGHLSRCLVLAQNYKNDHIVFATRDLIGNINYKIKDVGYDHVILKNSYSESLIDILFDKRIDLLIIDNYSIDYEYELKIKNRTSVKILSFDDTYQPHYCDVLLNHNIYAEDKFYKSLVPEFCELRCGGKYTLISNEFKNIVHKKRNKNRSVLKVFVSMGGADSKNINFEVIKSLMKIKDVTAELAVISSNPNLKGLLDFCSKNRKININVDHSNIADLMEQCDVAVVPPSVTLYEVMYLGLPFVAIKTSENQEYLNKYLQCNGFCSLNGFEEDSFIYSLGKLL